MTYYPKNKIKTNLFTNGGEYQTTSMVDLGRGNSYIGYYYSLANGTFYTGKYPGDGANEELFSMIKEETPTPTPKTFVPPLYPTPDDYKKGFFTRYFKKKANEFIFEELTFDQYNNVYTILYIPFTMEWQLIGKDINTVFNVNKNMALLTEQRNKVPGFTGYLNNDYARYYK